MANDQNQLPVPPPGFGPAVPYTTDPTQPQLAAAPAASTPPAAPQNTPAPPPGFGPVVPYTTDPTQPQLKTPPPPPPAVNPPAPPNPDDKAKWWEGPKEGGGFVLRDPALGDHPSLGEAAMHPMGKPVTVYNDMARRVNDFIAQHTPEGTPDALLKLVTGTVGWDAGFVNAVVEKSRQFILNPVGIATLGLSSALGTAKAAVPAAARVIGALETGTAGYFASQGAKSALTPRLPGESDADMIDRRLTGAATAFLGAAGATEGGKEVFKGISTNKIVNQIASTVGIPLDFDSALTSLAKPSAKQYQTVKAQVASISADMQSILNDARRAGKPMESPMDFVKAGDQHFQNHENELQRQAGATKDSAEPVVPDIEKRISDRLDAFFDEHKGLYGDDLQVREAKAKILEGILQTRNGVELQQPNLFEAENIRRRLGRQGAPQYATNAIPTTDAFKAGSLEAASEMRDAIDDAYREKGVKNVQPFRVKEKNWIDLRDRIELRQKQAEELGQPSLWRAVTSHVGIPAAVIGSAFGTGIGFITGDPAMGAEAGGAIGALAGTTADYIHQKATNPNSQVQRLSDLASKNPLAGKVEPTPLPPPPPGFGSVTPYTPPAPPAASVEPEIPAAAPTPRSPALVPRVEGPVDHQLHAALATYYGERIGQTSLDSLQTRFTAELQLKALQKKPNVSFADLYTPEEKNLLGKINDSDAKARIATQEKHQELLENSQKQADQALTKARSEADKQEAEASAKAIADEEKLNPKGGMMEPGSGLLLPVDAVGSYVSKANSPINEIPDELLPDGMTSVGVIHHELGHHEVGTNEGFTANDIVSHLHPRMDGHSAVAAIGFDEAPLIFKPGDYAIKELWSNSKKWLRTAMAGAAANELIDGLKPEDNKGLRSDIGLARKTLAAHGIDDPAMQDAFIKNAYNEAKAQLTKPGVIDRIKANAAVREDDLPDTHIMSAGRLRRIREQGGFDAKDNENILKPITAGDDEGGGEVEGRRPGKVGADEATNSEGGQRVAAEGAKGKEESRSTGREELSPETKKIIAEMPPNGGRAPVKTADLSPEAAEIIRNQPPNGQRMNVTKAKSATPVSDKLVEKYGETRDPLKAGYILADGRMVPLTGEHNKMLDAINGPKGPTREAFLNNEKAIRMRYRLGKGGNEVVFSVPNTGVNEDQISLMRQAVGKLGRNGNVVMEKADIGGASTTKEFARPSDIDSMLHEIEAHPEDQKDWADKAAAHAAEQGGGFTAHPQTGEAPTEGHQIEVLPEKREDVGHPVTADDIRRFHQTNKDIFDKHPELHVGGYGNELNVSAAGTPEGARYVGNKLDQRAGWDNKNLKEVPYEGKGEQTQFPEYPLAQRLKDLNPTPEPGVKMAMDKAEDQTTVSPKGSTVGLRDNPLKVKATGETSKPTTTDVAAALNKFSRKENPALVLGKAEPAEMVERAKSIAEDEAKYQLAQNNSEEEWYKADMKKHDNIVQDLRPELENPAKLSLFKMAEAVLSSGMKPTQNVKAALRAWDAYQETGKFPTTNPDTGKSWGPRGAAGYGMALDNLNRLIEEKGEKGASDWLLADHTVKDLRDYSKWVSGKQTDTVPGTMILGPKRGPFAQNLHGLESAFTADMWVSRTWNRWMGTLDVAPKEEGVTPESDSPRSDKERGLMKQSFAEVAQKLGKSTSGLQAVLWYYEQALYDVHGSAKETWSYSDAAKRAADEQGGFNFGHNEKLKSGLDTLTGR